MASSQVSLEQARAEVQRLTAAFARIKADMKVLNSEKDVVQKQLNAYLTAAGKTFVRNIQSDVQVVEKDEQNNVMHVVRKRKCYSLTRKITQKKVQFNKAYLTEVLKEWCMMRQIPLNVVDLCNFIWDAKQRTIDKVSDSLDLKEDASGGLDNNEILDLRAPMST